MYNKILRIFYMFIYPTKVRNFHDIYGKPIARFGTVILHEYL